MKVVGRIISLYVPRGHCRRVIAGGASVCQKKFCRNSVDVP